MKQKKEIERGVFLPPTNNSIDAKKKKKKIMKEKRNGEGKSNHEEC